MSVTTAIDAEWRWKRNHSIPDTGIAGIAKSMADFYLNNYDVTLNPNNEIFAFDGF
jgi:aspartate/methionine/tyrosine aminotransferase